MMTHRFSADPSRRIVQQLDRSLARPMTANRADNPLRDQPQGLDTARRLHRGLLHGSDTTGWI